VSRRPGDAPGGPVASTAPAMRLSLRKDSQATQVGRPPFERVLIANRGEIALRILRACRELGMEAVAVYSDADEGAAWVRLADVAVRIGPAPAAASYLDGEAILEAARSTGASAIHPGYGFLAERAAFARAVEEAGIVFVGPPATAIAALGDKVAARRTAADAGVPVVSGSPEAIALDGPRDAEVAIAIANEIGFPLFVKAAAGGGGRGMRRVDRPTDLPAALAAGAGEALSAFGDSRVYLEREVRPARHVEVQLLGDVGGTIVALGERDCSIQRRHQKLVEEAPAPSLGPVERQSLHDLAIRAASAAGLRNAATAEFLLDADSRPWFLEVNARLQVEHGVTELVSGVDIVREQFLLAAGNPLSSTVLAAAARAADPGRHAIEVRISAEDPAREFAPAPGRVGQWSMPSGPGVRVDTAIEAGERIPPEYDPLLAKVMVDAEDRSAAIDRLARALDEVEVTGIQTTLPFHLAVVQSGAFRDGDVSTDWVDEQWDGMADRERARRAAARLAAETVASRSGRGSGDGTVGESSGVGEASLRKDTPAADWEPGQRGGWLRAGRAEAVDRWPR
jgi:acetyl/propionyl-CoA carboxylase alpha subunit